jgi:hypothetical protein
VFDASDGLGLGGGGGGGSTFGMGSLAAGMLSARGEVQTPTWGGLDD